MLRQMGIRFAVALVALALLVGVGPGSVDPVLGGHSIPRDLSIKYSSNSKRFKGKIKSQVAVCRSGIVALHRAEPGPNPIVGSVQAAADGRWAIAARAGSSKWYADTEAFQASDGFCPAVRSKTINP